MPSSDISHEPRIFHLYPEYRPGTEEERNELINQACKAVHLLKSGFTAPALLRYYGNLENGARQDESLIREPGENQICSHPSSQREKLQFCGLIIYAPYNYIKVNWQTIYEFATFLDPAKTSKKYANAEYYHEESQGGRRMVWELSKKTGFESPALASQKALDFYSPFEKMTAAEFEQYLHHCSMLQAAEQSEGSQEG